MPAPKRADHRRGIKIPRAPRTLEDCVGFLSWLSVNLARGNLSNEDARAMTAAIKELREVLGARDADVKLAEAKRLLAELKAAR